MKKLILATILILTAFTTVNCSWHCDYWYSTAAGRDATAQLDYWAREDGDDHFFACGERQPGESRQKFRVRLQSEAVQKLHAAGGRLGKSEYWQYFLSDNGRAACMAIPQQGGGHYALEWLRPKNEDPRMVCE
ncbi:MAG: hypothetical protein WCT37_04890 [Patescibacteria group bacterium]